MKLFPRVGDDGRSVNSQHRKLAGKLLGKGPAAYMEGYKRSLLADPPLGRENNQSVPLYESIFDVFSRFYYINGDGNELSIVARKSSSF